VIELVHAVGAGVAAGVGLAGVGIAVGVGVAGTVSGIFFGNL
jgi:hypothetical protein